jgi:hypothetical protein
MRNISLNLEVLYRGTTSINLVFHLKDKTDLLVENRSK